MRQRDRDQRDRERRERKEEFPRTKRQKNFTARKLRNESKDRRRETCRGIFLFFFLSLVPSLVHVLIV